jgi:hypothetical protein
MQHDLDWKAKSIHEVGSAMDSFLIQTVSREQAANIANPTLGVKRITMDFYTPLDDERSSTYRYPTPPPAMKLLHRYTDNPTIEIHSIPKDMNISDYILTLFPAVEHIKIRLIMSNGMFGIIPRVVSLFGALIEQCEFTFVLVHVEMSRNPNVKEEDRRYLKEVDSAFLYTAWSVGLERKLRLTSYVGY